MSKGSARRPRQISREEEDLRWNLAYGKITLAEFTGKIRGLRRDKKKQKHGVTQKT